MKVIAVIPAYNEEKTLESVVREVKRYCPVIVVNDGSEDNTEKIAKNAGATVISHRKNMGYGKSLKDGVDEAIKLGADYIITLDGDGQHNPEDIQKFIKAFNIGADIISGSRFLGTKIYCSKKRKFAIQMLTVLFHIVSGLPLSDIQSGFRAYKKDVFIRTKIKEFGMEFSIEIILKAKKQGFVFMEIPIEIKYSKKVRLINSIRQGISVLYATIRYAF